MTSKPPHGDDSRTALQRLARSAEYTQTRNVMAAVERRDFSSAESLAASVHEGARTEIERSWARYLLHRVRAERLAHRNNHELAIAEIQRARVALEEVLEQEELLPIRAHHHFTLAFEIHLALSLKSYGEREASLSEAARYHLMRGYALLNEAAIEAMGAQERWDSQSAFVRIQARGSVWVAFRLKLEFEADPDLAKQPKRARRLMLTLLLEVFVAHYKSPADYYEQVIEALGGPDGFREWWRRLRSEREQSPYWTGLSALFAECWRSGLTAAQQDEVRDEMYVSVLRAVLDGVPTFADYTLSQAAESRSRAVVAGLRLLGEGAYKACLTALLRLSSTATGRPDSVPDTLGRLHGAANAVWPSMGGPLGLLDNRIVDRTNAIRHCDVDVAEDGAVEYTFVWKREGTIIKTLDHQSESELTAFVEDVARKVVAVVDAFNFLIHPDVPHLGRDDPASLDE